MTEKRRGLGRGLGALIPNSPQTEGEADLPPVPSPRPVDLFFPEATMKKVSRSAAARVEQEPELVQVPGARFAEVPVLDIHPNRKQPRTDFDQDAMDELVHSVREVGVLQPVVVRTSTESGPESYELVMGERRWRASQLAGLETIPVIIRNTTDDNLLRDALLENLHRSQLNPLDEAAAYQQLLEDFGTTHEELADRIGRSRPQVSNTLRLLKLPALVQRRVAAGVLSAGHARALLALPDSLAMERLAQRIIAEGMSVRATEEAVSLYQAPDANNRVPAHKVSARHERLDYLATSLSDKLDTNVKISLGARKGKVSIEFASVEDLNRIMDVLAPGAGG
ncbi:ParB/RepB/Spo0J family partition protein [Arthrobacter sp. H14-L1]|uniref:ParB/RepB/Spo0J family partition protein n=1 Tax=Arthrobacter sp. H14-L1 TaxID=2996697 RepID=UPI00226E3144|nr:ParB/RepB/Spo0J family partition protein [Arthrobacter sp. H14-L1]MCY0905104.1 ParB/RepB/Spo0J family partition protein [Arthrobacter sp. H14-L1]